MSSHLCRVWDLESGELKATLEGHGAQVNSVVVTPNGKYVVSGSGNDHWVPWDNTVRWVEADRKLLSNSDSLRLTH